MTPVLRSSYTTSTLGEGLWEIRGGGHTVLFDASMPGVLHVRAATCEDDEPVDDLSIWMACWASAPHYPLTDGIDWVGVGVVCAPEIRRPDGTTEVLRFKPTRLSRILLPRADELAVEEPVDLTLDLARRDAVLVVSTSEGEVVMVEPTDDAGTWSITSFWPGGRRQDAMHAVPEISWRWSSPRRDVVWGYTVERPPVGTLRRRTRGTVTSIRLVRL